MFEWDPNPVLFTIPIINRPIVWYGVLFAFGFFVGILLTRRLFREQLGKKYIVADIADWKAFLKDLQKGRFEKISSLFKKREIGSFLEKEKIPFSFKEKVVDLLNKNQIEKSYIAAHIIKQEEVSKRFVDRITTYVVIGAVFGARLFHIIFYEGLSALFFDPLRVFRVWEGGLASHGGVIGIVLALFLFLKRFKRVYGNISFIKTMDYLIIPAAFAGCMIRIGNFINQEILGKATSVFWSVIFKHPADGSLAIARHPVQLYESGFYFLLFALLYRFRALLRIEGRISGIFLFTAFTFRFFIETLKETQSVFDSSHGLLMGQILSIPIILSGLFLLVRSQRKLFAHNVFKKTL